MFTHLKNESPGFRPSVMCSPHQAVAAIVAMVLPRMSVRVSVRAAVQLRAVKLAVNDTNPMWHAAETSPSGHRTSGLGDPRGGRCRVGQPNRRPEPGLYDTRTVLVGMLWASALTGSRLDSEMIATCW